MARKKKSEPAPAEQPPAPEPVRPRRGWIYLAISVLLVAVAGVVAWYARGDQVGDTAVGVVRPEGEFVGTQSCAGCHKAEYAAWRGSQHDQAMMVATPQTVLAPFAGETFGYGGVESRFFRRDSTFWVRTDGSDGQLHDFPVKWTFGVYPLQQYLIELENGRIQPLTTAWDSRPAEEGGQRWFHLYPGERISHTDELHWTGLQQNWNFMCADCHSTNLQKEYDPEAGSFHTTWSEINVGCEGCHGPGSRHVELAEDGDLGKETGLVAALTERKGVRWSIDQATGNARRSEPRTTDREIEVCAQCHARRAQIGEDYVAGAGYHDYYQTSLLMPGLYWPDGQQRDEVYIYGSFRQSKMYHAGVTCSDCHEPHSMELRAPGNQLCGQCHSLPKYGAETHTFHPAGSEGAQCASCHMPTTTYMVVDPRHDHSFRVPRPDLSEKLGTPNACTQCHTDRSAGWAATRVREWYGHDPRGFQTFGEVFHASEQGAPGAAEALARLARDPAQPAIVRASALARSAEQVSPPAIEAAAANLDDPDPLVRRAALTVLEGIPPGERISAALPRLSDPVRTVRMEAAWLLAPVVASLAGEERAAFDRAAEEFIASQRYNADRPESRTTLGTFFLQLGRLPEAEAQYRAATRIAPRYAPAYVNLADLYRAQGREGDAEQALRRGLQTAPNDPTLRHSLGLALVRAGRVPDAVAELKIAAELAPENPRMAYVYAVALQSSGRVREGITVLERALQRAPRDRDILFALSTFARDAGDLPAARRWAARLAQSYPTDSEAQQLVASLE